MFFGHFTKGNDFCDFLFTSLEEKPFLFGVDSYRRKGWSGGAMVLGKLPVPGRPTNLDDSRVRAYCACSGCGWGLFGHLFSSLSFLSFLPLSGRRHDID